MKSIQSIRRGERLTILILIVFFLGMGVLVWKVVKESSFYMSHSDDVTLGMVYDRNNQILFDPNASTETYDENYFLDVGNVIGDDSGQMTNTLVSENIEKLQNYSLIFGATPHGKRQFTPHWIIKPTKRYTMLLAAKTERQSLTTIRQERFWCASANPVSIFWIITAISANCRTAV